MPDTIQIEVNQTQAVVYFENGATEVSDWFNTDAYAEMFADIFKKHPLYAYHEFKKRTGTITASSKGEAGEPHPFAHPSGKYYNLYQNRVK